MTIAAVAFVEFVADIHRMGERSHGGAGRNIFLNLPHDLMAKVTILPDDMAIGGFMLIVMTTEATGEVEVTDVIWIGPP